MTQRVLVVGAGLAGCEAAWQLVRRGVPVRLVDIKPKQFTPAHRSEGFAELVCSNSLRANNVENAVGLLKEEMRRLGSLVMEAADVCRVPAGGALAVDREGFSAYITERLKGHPLVEFCSEEVTKLPQGLSVVATGPLTTAPLFDAISREFGAQHLSFFDAAAPIVTFESLDKDKIFFQSRYGKGTADYINCPMDKEQYEAFYEALVTAQTAQLHGFEDDRVFEGCMPVETMARRGRDTLRFGPLKPVGLVDPATGREPYAVVQLRQDDAARTLYNLVGFQTHLKFGEQRRVFGMIPGLERAEFVRYGVMHRNTYLNGPALLEPTYRCRLREGLTRYLRVALFCRADDGGRGLCGVGLVGACCRHQCGASGAGAAADGISGADGHRGAGGVRLDAGAEQFPAHERQFRHYGAARFQVQGKAGKKRGPGQAVA